MTPHRIRCHPTSPLPLPPTPPSRWHVYNNTNDQQKALNAIALPWSISVAQLVVGSVFVLPLWFLKLREAPGLTMENVKSLSPIALCHMLSHVCAVIGLGGTIFTFLYFFINLLLLLVYYVLWCIILR